MVPKVLCATFNHYWGKVTETRKVVSRPLTAEFTGNAKGAYVELLVVAERVEIVTTSCDGCDSVASRVIKEEQTPHSFSLSIDRRINQIHVVDPMSLICPVCSTILRPAVIGGGRVCWKCSPPSFPTMVPPPGGYVNEWTPSHQNKLD